MREATGGSDGVKDGVRCFLKRLQVVEEGKLGQLAVTALRKPCVVRPFVPDQLCPS